MGGVAFDGVDGVGGVCVSGGRDARVGLRCCVSCMQVSFSGEVFWAGVVGEVVLSCRRSRGEAFHALHCRRLSLVFLFVFCMDVQVGAVWMASYAAILVV